MQKVIHREEERGREDYGWLKTRYSFSFSNWFEPSRMGFGKLRVINDDIIAPLGMFDTHSHKDFEIITIPLVGAVTHEDNMGNKGMVTAGEVQAMSAGRGVMHSERNASATETLQLFQIWIEPKAQGAVPRYAQAEFEKVGRDTAWQLLVSSDGTEDSLPIYQDARILRADLGLGDTLPYSPFYKNNGLYVLVIEGKVEAMGDVLARRDAVGVAGVSTVEVTALSDSQILLIEVPMS
jgi:quercetin 2,3-dioxygenase